MKPMPLRGVAKLAAVLAAATVLVPLAGAAPASASHLQGGYFTANVTATGRLQGTVTYLERYACTSGLGSQKAIDFTITSPVAETVNKSVTGTATRCLPGSATYTGSFDIPLDTSTFPAGAPDGDYTLTWRDGNRVGGIVNLANSSNGWVQFRAKVHKVALQATGAPYLGSNVATGVGVGIAYSQNLNARDPDGGALTYETLLKPGDADAPDYDVITLSQTGQVTISAADTAGFTAGQYYVYKVRVTDAQGDFAERDVLLKVGDNNAPPALSGLDTINPYEVRAGEQRTITFSASDDDAGDAVEISAAGLPAWATLTTTPGNPAQATLTLAPPANVAAGSFGISIDAVDDASVPLTDSALISIDVLAASPRSPAAPVITAGPARVAATSRFEFTGAAGARLECRIDAGAWATCASPYGPAGLADGPHTLEVRQRVGGGNPSPAASYSWTLDTAAPAAPQVLAGPDSRTDAREAAFEFAGEPEATFECRLDGGAWAACTSPKRFDGLTPGAHVFELRQRDVAGNVSAVRTERWTIASDKPEAPGGGSTPVTAVLPTAGVAVEGSKASVGCRSAGARITRCTVKVYARVGGRLVLIGTGRTVSADGSRRVSVDVRLNEAGRRYVRRVGGVKAIFKVAAATRGGGVVKTTDTARLLPPRMLVIPSSLLFGVDQAELTPRGKQYLRGMVDRLAGVKTMTCIGHTDATGPAQYNLGLGLRRAQAVCGYLRAVGVKATMRTSSAGASRPRASNDTARGRELNRRVELDLRYR
jgi:outer membrane protein OmpA-like peptidoglycan-associated protein